MRLWENKRQVYTGSLELVYHYFNLDFDYQMAKLLILGDSQIERVWNNVRGNREMLQSAFYFPVKNRNSLLAGFQAAKPTVSWILCYFKIATLFAAFQSDYSYKLGRPP